MESLESRTSVAANPMLWDEPDTRIIYGTLRSGQKVETEHSIVIFGDVNSGAEVIAGGDIVILGTLRGIAHAGAYDESGGGRVIFSLNLQPTQLRIGLVISRGSGSENFESTPRGGMPEIARVEGNLIVVEPYQSRTVWARRRE
jgi:septum site-determining protein MinC